MSWEILPERYRKERTDWGMSAGKTGITIWIPEGHPLNKSPCVVTQIGKDEDLGYIRLLPSTTGRKIIVPNKKFASRFIKYTTLPGYQAPFKMVTLEAREVGGGVLIKLPWRMPGAPYSMLGGSLKR